MSIQQYDPEDKEEYRCDLCSAVARAVAAEKRAAELERDIAEEHAAYLRTINDQRPKDEQHCACVPDLRKRISELERSLSRLRNAAARAYNVLTVHDMGAAAELDRAIVAAAARESER